ncbi:hypothetical protein B0J13DRAFT_501166 [Dactylonectria estremocensis]|uniref:Uncharacterized protein n=1 Tax=Dactylonectria estremocensis TaxID=1079267 RepID=A0A9P9EUX6_9HYPO|nr:hypothetical protein B0J13DRAFT_501166 [Dactylonectria estremocensis]
MSDDHDSPRSASVSDCSAVSEPPRCDPEKIRAAFIDFYTFLTTLHYDKADLKIPPPGGWPCLTPELCADYKPDETIQVLRNLPYFDRRSLLEFHYHSRLLDYTTFTRQDFEEATEDYEPEQEFWGFEGQIDPGHLFCIAEGSGYGGHHLFLNARDGEIIQDTVGVNQESYPVEEYFDTLMKQYRNLELIPCPGRVTLEASNVDKRDIVSLEEVCNQMEYWPTDLDIQYVRQLYRQHGWPGAFRKDEATKAIDDLMSVVKNSGGKCRTWESKTW